MSSILKALKKLDAQKSPAETTGPDLSTSQESPTPPRPWLPLGAGIALGALLVAALIVWYEKPATVAPNPVAGPLAAAEGKIKEQPFVRSEALLTASPSALQVESTPPPEAPAPVQPKVKPPESLPVEARLDSVETPALDQKPRITPLVEQVATRKLPVASPVEAVGKSAPVAMPATAEATGKTSDLPLDVTLVVSEIFFQEGSTDNMAVVNDLPVMEGTQIEGAIVEKILVDRVVFKIDDKQYDILSSTSAQ